MENIMLFVILILMALIVEKFDNDIRDLRSRVRKSEENNVDETESLEDELDRNGGSISDD